jgi:putative transposase
MGVLDRLILRDDQWERMSAHIIGDERTRGSSGRANRMFVEAVVWIVRTGSPWRGSARGVRRLEQRLPPFQPLEP